MSATCFFIGHRNTPESVFLPLLAAVERHITEYGVTDFVVGHYGRFDSLAAQAVVEAKKTPSASDAYSPTSLSSVRAVYSYAAWI